jgi:hypothetical protein
MDYNQHIKTTFHKAFFDLLEQKVSEEPPDYEWITRLYAEIKEKLLVLLAKDSPLAKEIDEKLDVALFKQMIEHNVFDSNDFYNLICYVFELILKLGAPARDNEVLERKSKVLEGKTFATIVPLFIKHVNEAIDLIYEDLHAIKKNLAR